MQAFTANYSFVNSGLAAIYKVSPARFAIFDRVEFPAAGRAHWHSWSSFVSHSDEQAGGYGADGPGACLCVNSFLCQHVPPPPPGVDTNLAAGGRIAARHQSRTHGHATQTNKMCAGCHTLIDPIGFGFEKFDAIGMYHDKARLLFYAGGGRRGQRARSGETEGSLPGRGHHGKRSPGCRMQSLAIPGRSARLLARHHRMPGMHRNASLPVT